MAKFKLKSYIKSAHGRMDNVVYFNVRGCQYVRSYSIPHNPRTEAQQKNRANFAEGVKIWHSLTEKEKSAYNRMAEGTPLSGYNLFISMHMKGVTIKLLKEARRVKVRKLLILTPYRQTGTPLLPPLSSLKGPICMYKSPNTPGIPPGISAPAA